MKSSIIFALVLIISALPCQAEEPKPTGASAYEIYVSGMEATLEEIKSQTVDDESVGSGTLTYGVCNGDTVTSNDLDPDCISDATIRELGESGRICEVFGHQWRHGTKCRQSQIDYGYAIACPEDYTGMEYRHCTVCGKEQVKVVEWEKVDEWNDR